MQRRGGELLDLAEEDTEDGADLVSYFGVVVRSGGGLEEVSVWEAWWRLAYSQVW